MFKNIFITFILFFWIILNSSAIYVNPKIEKVYSSFVLKIESKNSDLLKQKKIFDSLESKINQFKNSTKYRNNSTILNIFDQFLYLNNLKIKNIEKALIVKKFSSSINSNNSNLLYTSKSDNKDQVSINKANIYEINHNKEIDFRKSLINKYSYTKYFKNISYTKNHIFLENWVWYTYLFNNYNYFPTTWNVTKSDLEYNNINLDKDLLFVTKKNTLWFVKNPKKVKLISDYIISDIDNKYYFLEELKDDLKNAWSKDYDNDFIKLKSLSKSITYNLSNNSKIKNIYNYILNNVEYSSTVDFDNYKIFSWIETYKNKDWICEWYVKMMSYMTLFAWINDVEVIRWYVIDAKDFPKVWHAWLRIWTEFYDPTFDDPIGAKEAKNYSDYKYFKLPKDLFYTNRYDELDLPKYIKSLSLDDRKKIIQKNLNNLLVKYQDYDYKLLDLLKFKKTYKINYDEKITLDNFTNILPLKVVSNFTFLENWSKKQIYKFKYYNLNNDNIENIIEQLDFNIVWYYYFKWLNDNWTFDYKLAFDVKT